MYGSYTMWLMMPYLTDVWDMSIIQAAAVINIFDGVVAILPLGLRFIIDSLGNPMMADYWMLLWSGISGILGLLLVTMSTPPMLSKATGTCSKYEPKCIGNTQVTFFYTGLVLLVTAMATCITSQRSYMFERGKRMGLKKPHDIWNVRQALVRKGGEETLLRVLQEAKSSTDPKVLKNRAYHWPTEFWLYRCNAFYTIVLIVLVCWVMPWSLRLGIPVIILLLSTLLFVAKPWYHITGVEEVSSIEPFVTSLMIKTIAKFLICKFPIWSTFVVGGLVSSVGNTYFMEQAEQMDPKLGHWEVPTAFFMLVYRLVNYVTTKICKVLISSRSNKSRWAITVFSLGVSVVCCMSAALVEKRRLDVVKSHGLIDKSEGSVPLSMFLMLPQFFFLGVLDGTYNFCVFNFFQEQTPRSLKKYLNSFLHFVLGLGILCNVLSVYIVGKVSGRGGRQTWFQPNLNKSRLDYYYWMLTVLSAINFAIYLLVALYYSKFRESELPEPLPHSEIEEVQAAELRGLDWFDLVPLRQ
ncbi:hypothetical protein BVRB_7g159790 [Beta vulgaris subsp. vulgaris]|nr:hypothetical protein BVRB_7g159790 [Beta vulgaris subsp. vulgaris]